MAEEDEQTDEDLDKDEGPEYCWVVGVGEFFLFAAEPGMVREFTPDNVDQSKDQDRNT